MDGLIEFFGAGSANEAIYWLIGSLSTGFLGSKFLLNLIGIDLDHEFDFDFDGPDISLSAFAALFSISGWTGIAGYKMTDMGDFSILLFALATGIIGFVSSVYLMGKMKGLEVKGNIDLENAVGKVAEVYLSIPGKRTGEGQVNLIVQQRLCILDALTDGEGIQSGEKVLVYATEEGKLLVEPYKEAYLKD